MLRQTIEAPGGYLDRRRAAAKGGRYATKQLTKCSVLGVACATFPPTHFTDVLTSLTTGRQGRQGAFARGGGGWFL